MNNVEWCALLLTVFAGMSTVIGSSVALFARRSNTKLLAISLGFSAGVMIYVSMAELMNKSKDYLISMYGSWYGMILSTLSFFVGIALIGLIDYFIPSAEGDIGNKENKNVSLKKMSLLTTLAIAIHNFPEGLVTFASTLSSVKLGVMIAIAIAIHNIPEGIATALPVYFSTGSRKKAFFLSVMSGLTEPLGAVIGYFLLKPIINDAVIGVLFGIIAGIMIFISLEELLPMAREYEKSKLTILSVVMGMAIMALSLILFA